MSAFGRTKYCSSCRMVLYQARRRVLACVIERAIKKDNIALLFPPFQDSASASISSDYRRARLYLSQRIFDLVCTGDVCQKYN